MHDTVILGAVRICFFLAAVCSYVYIFWTGKPRRAAFLGPPSQPDGVERKQENLIFATQQLTPPVGRQAGGGAGKSSTPGKLAAAGDWLVPLVVWVLVILMTAAIVGFLLGGR